MLIKPKTVITPKVIYISACKVTEVPSFSCGLNNLFTQWLILVELVPVYQLWREKKETEKECLHESIRLAMKTATCVNACQTLKQSNSQGHLHLLAKSQKPLVSHSLKSFTHGLILVQLVTVYKLWRGKKETEKECLHESISLAMNTAACVNACQALKLSNSQHHLHLLAKSQKPLVSHSLDSFTQWLILVQLITAYKLQRGKKETEKRISAWKHRPRYELHVTMLIKT